MKSIMHLSRFVKPYWFITFLVAPFLMIIEVTATLFQPVIMQYVIDHGIAKDNTNVVVNYTILMLICTFISLIAGVSCIYVSTKVSVYAASDLRSALYIKTSYFTMKQREEIGVGKLITNLTNDVNIIQRAFMMLLLIFVRGPFILIGAIIIIWFKERSLFFILLSILFILAILIALFSYIARHIYGKVQSALDAVNTLLFDTLFGIRVIKAYHRMKDQIQRFTTINGHYTKKNKEATQFIGALNPITIFIVNMGIIGTLWIGVIKVDTDGMKVGVLLAFINYLNLILNALTLSTMVLMQMVRSIPSIQRLHHIFTLQKDSSITTEQSKKEINGRISFQQVSFQYPHTQTSQLKNLNFHIYPGQTIGIIGAIGSGKTTLLNVITRLYTPEKGMIYIDEKPIENYNVDDLRRQMAVVPQRAFLFSGSVASNLQYGYATTNTTDLIQVLKDTNAWSLIQRQHENMHTTLKSNIHHLAFGQKQRIAMARAIIRQAKILIVDDLMPSVDIGTRSDVQHYLKNKAQNQTVLIASSNIPNVQSADRLLLLEDGEIIAQGTHEELLQISPTYKNMYKDQSEGGGA